MSSDGLFPWENPMKIGEVEVPPLDIQDDKTACRAEKMGRPQDRKAGSLNMPSNCRSCLKLFHTSNRQTRLFKRSVMSHCSQWPTIWWFSDTY